MLLKLIRKKIANQLTLGFITLSIVSSLLMGAIFLQIFYTSHLHTKTASLLSYGYQIANTYDGNKEIVELYDSLLDARIWILGQNQRPIISNGHHNHHHCGQNPEAPCQVKGYDSAFIEEVYGGNEVISKANSTFYYGATLSVGIPITKNQEVVGAVLIHAPLKAVYEPIQTAALYLGIGIVLSTLLTFIVARYYAYNFTHSIRAIKQTASLLMEGDYSAKSTLKREDEIGDLSHALSALALKLKEASEESDKLEQIRRDFVANVSHEFRTPLTVIRGNIEGLMDQTFKTPQTAYETIYSETLILQQLVTDLLDLSRLQQGKIDLKLEAIYIPDLIYDAIRSIRQLSSQKNIILKPELAPSKTPVETDYLRLRQIIIILLDNAVKYTPNNGSVELHLKETEIGYQLTIQDTGIGIAAEDLPYIWNRFYKVNKARDAHSSTGLGLAIAKNLMEVLDIHYTIQSTLNIGTIITLSIPFTSKI